MKIAISAESTIDLPQEMLDKYDIHIVHFHVQQGDKEGFDDLFTNDELFDFTIKTGIYCHTSAPNIQELTDHFNKLHKMGYEKIIHFTISSQLSSGYANAVSAADGDQSIKVVDSHGTAGGIANLALYACDLRDAGYSFEEIFDMVEARVPFSQCSFQLDRLDFLYKGGRCSKLSLIGANLLKIRPEIVCEQDGKFGLGRKHRGNMEKCDLEYINGMLTQYGDRIDKRRCFINFSTMDDEHLAMFKKIAEDFGFEEVFVYRSCPTNSYHAGPNVVGIQFLYDGPHPIVKK